MEIKNEEIMEHELVFNIKDSYNLKPVVNKLDEMSCEYSILNVIDGGYRVCLLLDKPFIFDEKEAVALFFKKEIKKLKNPFVPYSKTIQEITL